MSDVAGVYYYKPMATYSAITVRFEKNIISTSGIRLERRYTLYFYNQSCLLHLVDSKQGIDYCNC